MGVSRSGYYDWRSRPVSAREQKNQQIVKKLTQCFEDSQRTYGVIRLTKDLNALGEEVNHKRVARLKRLHRIFPKQHKAYVATTDSTHGQAVARNVLSRQFKTEEENQIWTSDITYLPMKSGWVYLAVILDLFSRKIIGWHIATHLRAELVVQALDVAKARRSCLPKLFHSDQGVQYISDDVAKELPGVTISMSRKGNCWDNALAESFFGTLKHELVNFERYETIYDARRSVFQYIEGFYNRTRRQSHLDYLSPQQFEEKKAKEKAA